MNINRIFYRLTPEFIEIFDTIRVGENKSPSKIDYMANVDISKWNITDTISSIIDDISGLESRIHIKMLERILKRQKRAFVIIQDVLRFNSKSNDYLNYVESSKAIARDMCSNMTFDRIDDDIDRFLILREYNSIVNYFFTDKYRAVQIVKDFLEKIAGKSFKYIKDTILQEFQKVFPVLEDLTAITIATL